MIDLKNIGFEEYNLFLKYAMRYSQDGAVTKGVSAALDFIAMDKPLWDKPKGLGEYICFVAGEAANGKWQYKLVKIFLDIYTDKILTVEQNTIWSSVKNRGGMSIKMLEKEERTALNKLQKLGLVYKGKHRDGGAAFFSI